MNTPELFNESNRSTYCMESDKLHLYVGRVPRAEYDALRAEGWTSTPKQSEAGQGEFAATWTPAREDTALSYSGIIEDEDAGPAERAADRAERFAGYRQSRLSEATGHADRFDSGPQAHGFQSYARAVRSADRHDRIAGRAVNAWDRAEYWQTRTAGVISNALHRAKPGVRMGRIKVLEAELRKAEKEHSEATRKAQARFDSMLSVMEHAAGTREKLFVADAPDFRWELSKIRETEGVEDDKPCSPEQLRRAAVISCMTGHRASEANHAKAKEAKEATRPAAEIAKEWTDANPRPEDWDSETGTRYTRHLKLRIAYELQMLEEQGGRAALVEMEVGGWLGGNQIHRVNRSNATGRVVSVGLKVRTNGKDVWGRPDPKAKEFRMATINIERLTEDSYRAPTEEEKAAFAAKVKADKKAAPKSTAPPRINPTLGDAQRLQAMWNATVAAAPRSTYGTQPEPQEVLCMTQAQYSARSADSYSSVGTREIDRGGKESPSRYYVVDTTNTVCKVRVANGAGSCSWNARRVIHITDKPARALPPSVWEAVTVPTTPAAV